MMQMQGRLLLVLILVLILILSITISLDASASASASASPRLELIHRHAPQLNRRPPTQLDRIKELAQSDILRHEIISRNHRHNLARRKARETFPPSSPIQMSIFSGRDFGLAQYFVSIRVGTPAQKFTMIVDLGSELTWMNCRYHCGRICSRKGRIRRRRAFLADLSSSFSTIPCFSRMCKTDLMNLFSLAACPTPLAPCAYDYRYLDSSATKGIFAKETITLGLTNGRKTRLQNVLIGCSNWIQGPSFDRADGVIGLGYSNYSFTAKATRNLGGQFSYCLVDHLSHSNLSNYLTFGGRRSISSVPVKMTYTQLELGLVGTFYAVNVAGISVGGVFLDIPVDVWDASKGGGTILDSGSSLTYLITSAYGPVMAALKRSVSKFKSVVLDGVPMEYCFSSAEGFSESLVPRLIFHFADGAQFKPHVKSYIIDAADGVRCIGILEGKDPGVSIIGNIMQQNFLWAFQIAAGVVGFAPSTCT